MRIEVTAGAKLSTADASDDLVFQHQWRRCDRVAQHRITHLRLPEQTAVAGIESMVAKFTTDIPALTKWGTPVLLGPGSIHVAHTEREYISKKQLHDAVELYSTVARQLLESSS